MRLDQEPPTPRPNQQEMTGLNSNLGKCSKVVSTCSRTARGGNFPTSSPRWSRPLTQLASARMGWARLAPLGPESPILNCLKAPRRKDGRRGWLWAPAIEGWGHRWALPERPRNTAPTGAGFAPHSPCARAPYNSACQPLANCVSASRWTTTPRAPAARRTRVVGGGHLGGQLRR